MLQAIGSVVALLACPLMMIFMMRGMHGGHEKHGMHPSTRRKFRSAEEELADVKRQVDDLQTRYDRLSQRVKDRPGHLG
ncbi:DUF2933 domain-containing protein [Alicyclobacillus macrosporangiidus]|uniref:DUF2933 domain-containing protein n=1 Tax=Alicyclobacillus macrosporangiidus TaxID=392015 RepID=A0A1I7L8U1_9BACL|nr:DUF2933 domain-containing protein [Alicyclobacillus macrosporangiidus]SFV05914.1 Protein of unknown function [Alicyclobacillus macrosporangiidus]